MTEKVNSIGDEIRAKKKANASKEEIMPLVAKLKEAKEEYWKEVGHEWPADVEAREKKKKKK